MPERLSGNLQVFVRFTGKLNLTGMGCYAGRITVPGLGSWQFSELWLPRSPSGQAWNTSEMYDRAAAAAITRGPDAGPCIAKVLRDQCEVFPEQTLGGERPLLDRAHIADDGTVIYRSPAARDTYYAALEVLARQRRIRPQLQLSQGGRAS